MIRFKPSLLPFPFYVAFIAAVIMTLTVVAQIALDENSWVSTPNHLMVFGSNYLVWALMTPIIFSLIQKHMMADKPWYQVILMVTILGSLIILFQAVTSNSIYYIFRSLTTSYSLEQMLFTEIPNVYKKALFSRSIDFVLIFGVLAGIWSLKAYNDQKTQLAAVKEQLSEAKLAALRMQLNPHFLFNALHTVNAFIGKDDQKARKALILLSNLLRKTLHSSEEEMVTLDKEIEYLRDYLNLESIRFEDRLIVEFEIDKQVESKRLPYLLLQPIVENALKHGIANNEEGGEVKLKAGISGSSLEISITNTNCAGIISQGLSKNGVGLRNVKDRLEQHYGDQFELTSDYNENISSVCIKIPLEHAD